MPNVPGQADHAAPKSGLKWANYAEPAMLRAVAAAVVALVAALGLTLPFDLPGLVEAAIGTLAVLVPLIQGKATREAVVSPQHADLIARGASASGLANGPR